MDHDQVAGLNPLENNIHGGFELHDFIDGPNFDQFIDLIRGENEGPLANFGCDDLINGCFIDNQFAPIPNVNPDQRTFGIDTTILADPSPLHMTIPDYNVDIMVEEDDNNDHGEDSSAVTNTTNTGKKPKVDRSKTLISERRRRGRMKEKLYALRSLVPNITKVRT